MSRNTARLFIFPFQRISPAFISDKVERADILLHGNNLCRLIERKAFRFDLHDISFARSNIIEIVKSERTRQRRTRYAVLIGDRHGRISDTAPVRRQNATADGNIRRQRDKLHDRKRRQRRNRLRDRTSLCRRIIHRRRVYIGRPRGVFKMNQTQFAARRRIGHIRHVVGDDNISRIRGRRANVKRRHARIQIITVRQSRNLRRDQ